MAAASGMSNRPPSWHYPGVNISTNQSPQYRQIPSAQPGQQHQQQYQSHPSPHRQQQHYTHAVNHSPTHNQPQSHGLHTPPAAQFRGGGGSYSSMPIHRQTSQPQHFPPPPQHPAVYGQHVPAVNGYTHHHQVFQNTPGGPASPYSRPVTTAPIYPPAPRSPSASPGRAELRQERGRPLPTPTPTPNASSSSFRGRSPSRAQSMLPPPVHPRSPGSTMRQLEQSQPIRGHAPSHSLPYVNIRGPVASQPASSFGPFIPSPGGVPPGVPRSSNMTFIPPTPSQARSRSLSPTKLSHSVPLGNALSTPTPSRRPLPHSPTAPPDLSQLRRSMSHAGTAGPLRRGTVNEMASRFGEINTSVNAPSASISSKPESHVSHARPQPLTTAHHGNQGMVAISQPARSSYAAPTAPQPEVTPPTQMDSEVEIVYSGSDFESISSLSRPPSIISAFSESSNGYSEDQDTLASRSPTSPQFGILDMPRRNSQNNAVEQTEEEPTSPQYGILDMPRNNGPATSGMSVSERKRVWEGSSGARSQHKLEMPPMRQPQPSRTGRQPSWSLPSANLTKHEQSENIQGQTTVLDDTPKKAMVPPKGQDRETIAGDVRAPLGNSQHAYQKSRPQPKVGVNAPPSAQGRTHEQAKGPNSHLSMALRLAARSLEEERGPNAVPPGYRGIGNDVDVSPSKYFTTASNTASTQSLTHSSKFATVSGGGARVSAVPSVTTPQSPSTSTSSVHRLSGVPSPVSSPTKQKFFPFTRTPSHPPSPHHEYDLNNVPVQQTPHSLSRSLSTSTSRSQSRSSTSTVPMIRTPDDSTAAPAIHVHVPTINFPGNDEEDNSEHNMGPSIVVSPTPSYSVSRKPLERAAASMSAVPTINLPGDEDESGAMQKGSGRALPDILTDLASSSSTPASPTKKGRSLPQPPTVARAGSSSFNPPLASGFSAGAGQRKPGASLVCGACETPIFGRIVSAMGTRWHPNCFKCSICSELLEHVSAFERDGKPYCHLDYHELFAPSCYHCKTPIIDERFITLDDPALGKRTYHEQHFFCAECGDPFLAPSIPKSSSSSSNNHSGSNGKNHEITIHGDGAFDLEDDVGFTVFRGHPYCETCHVRLRAPRCRGCNKSIKDGIAYELAPDDDDGRRGAVEALGGKWHWDCFVCAGCSKPFDEPSFFQRDKKPFCEPCFSLILRNEI